MGDKKEKNSGFKNFALGILVLIFLWTLFYNSWVLQDTFNLMETISCKKTSTTPDFRWFVLWNIWFGY